jgi:beta-lactamase regulating signal transducer with metallopeptidase domain
MTPIEAVLNTFWPSAAVALAAWLGMRILRVDAATRSVIWWAVLAGIVVLPLAHVERARRQPARPRVVFVATDAIPAARSVIAMVSRRPKVELPRGNWTRVLPLLWVAAFLIQLLRLAVSAIYLHRLKRDTQPAPPELCDSFRAFLAARGVRRPARLLLSSSIPTPVAAGFFRPAVILPAALVLKLSREELDHILLHEIAHLARRDDWSQLAAGFAWSVLALHPVAAWVLTRIGREREIACDDWVVAGTGSPRRYAESLARLFEVCTARPGILLASGITGNGSQLGDRIALLLRRGRAFSSGISPVRVAVGSLAVLALAGIGSTAPSWVAFASPQGKRSRASAPVAQAPVAPAPAAAAQAQAASKVVVRNGGGHSFLADLVAAGYGDLSVDDIVNLKVQGVTGEYLIDMNQAGWGTLPPQKIIDLKVQGVSPEYVAKIHGLGFGPYSPQEIINMKVQGVSPDLCRALRDYGIRQADASELIEAQVNGVKEGSLRAARSYSPTLTIKQIVKLKQAGVI